MSYTPTTWTTGDTITATKLNKIEQGIADAGGGGGWDAIIHLEHSNNSGDDSATNLTVSIVSGTHADLSAKISDGESPCILVEYHHPWGIYFAVPMAFITYAGVASIEIVIAGYSPTRYTFAVYGTCVWFNDDTIAWD